jgi:hypothetical protein
MVSDGPSPVERLRTINTAALTYSSAYAHGFPPTLAVLAPPKAENGHAGATPNEKAADLLPDFLALGTSSGYRYTYVAGKVEDNGMIVTYTVHADPIKMKRGEPDDLHYFTDQSGVIRMEKGKEANQDSKPING